MSVSSPIRDTEACVQQTTVAAAIARVLEAAGVRRMYTVPGESALELLDIVGHASSIEIISNRHESGSSFMAAADAKLTGVPAVAIAGRGVGATNLSIGVHTARHDSTPMLVILGQVESDVLGREAFQEVDLAAFYAPIAKMAVQASRPERVPELIAEALRVAQAGRPGPAVVVVPTDFFGAQIDRVDIPVSRAEYPTPSPADVEAIAEALAAASAPVAIVGAGGRDAYAELIEFAERYQVGVYTAFRRQDVFPNDHPLHLGHLNVKTDPEILQALEDADFVLALGTRLSEVTTQGYAFPRPGVCLAHVDLDPTSIGKSAPANMAVIADVRATLRALAAAPVVPRRRDWTRAHQRYADFSTPTPPAHTAGAGVHPTEIMAAMRDVLPADTIITSDAGNYAIFLHRFWRFTEPKTQLAPTNGAMGYGVPAAVAAKLAAPERPVVCVVGDGGFLMTAAELETAARNGAPLICVVFRNGLYGTIATHQLRSFGRTTAVDIAAVDLATYARGLGCAGVSVEEPSGLRPALTAALTADRPTVIDVRTDPDVLSPTDLRSVMIAERA
jgi:acetolactate synthase-1/2/3 large subunit